MIVHGLTLKARDNALRDIVSTLIGFAEDRFANRIIESAVMISSFCVVFILCSF